MVRSSAFPVVRGHGNVCGARAKRDAIQLERLASCFATRPPFTCKRHASIAASEIAEIEYTHHRCDAVTIRFIVARHRDGRVELVRHMKKPAT